MQERIGILGYGRFGSALAVVCRDAGLDVRAFDTKADVPPDLRAGSVAELCAPSTLLVVAVPLERMEEAFRSLAPLARPGQVVIDVGSVKVLPARTMAEAFGERVGWVATHPLFGPASLARGERPLRVVVCPNPIHPEATSRTEAFFRALGCTPMEQSPEAHDQEMALTHALVFFVAKGMLDAGIPIDAPHAPPSFHGLAKSIESVREDAGHLFAPLHRYNPFAAAARRRLLETLQAADRLLADAESSPSSPSPALAIPDLGTPPAGLLQTRELIDDLDGELLGLLARRAELSRRAGRAKAERGLTVTDPSRESQLLSARRRGAAELGLDADAVEEIFQAILKFSRSVQR